MQPKIINALLCDLVRTETSGKHILIGIYSGDIVFSALPASIPLALYVEVAPGEKNITLNFELRIELPGKADPLHVSGAMSVKNESTVVVNLNMPAMHISRTGTLRVFMRFSEEEWTQMIEKAIIVQPPAVP